MKNFLSSVGLQRVIDEIDLILYNITQDPDNKYVLGLFDEDIYVEYTKFYGEDIGLSLRGTMDDSEQITVSNYFPIAKTVRTLNTINIEILSDGTESEAYAICEEEATGNEFSFYVQNYAEYLTCDSDSFEKTETFKMELVALADSGTIVLPLVKDEYSEQLRYEDEQQYKDLVKRLRDGDNSASELLAKELMDTTKMIHERLKDEDFLTIVSSYFIPLQEDKALYYVLGDIIDVQQKKNNFTKDTVWQLTVDVTGTIIDIFVGAGVLVGLPMKGMRFIGTCLLQGHVYFK